MKQKDVALIIVIVFISAMVSFFVSRSIIVPPKNRQEKVEVVEPITADFSKTDSRFFNRNAFDPTQPISISQNQNPDPFSASGQ